MTHPSPAASLSQALLAVEVRHRAHHWHCWRSDAGTLWATSPECMDPDGSGTTVGDVGAVPVLERLIAETEHHWHMLGSAA